MRGLIRSDLAFSELWNGCVIALCPSVDRSRSSLVTDFSAGCNHASTGPTTQAPTWSLSRGNAVLDFASASNQYVSIPVRETFQNDVSVSMWVYPRTAGQNNAGRLISLSGLNVRLIASGVIQSSSDAGGTNLSSTGTISFNNWNHIAVVRTILPSSISLQFFINGILAGTGIPVSILNINENTLGNVNSGFVYTRGADALINDVRVYTRGLYGPEIRNLATRQGIAYEVRRRFGRIAPSVVGGINGSASGSLPLPGSATGTVRVQGVASGSLSLTGSATGEVLVQGSASGSLSLTGSSTGTTSGFTAIASGNLSLTGSALGTVSVQGVALGNLPLTGSATGATFSGSIAIAFGELPLTGSATGTVVIRGSAAGNLSLSGTSTGATITPPGITGTAIGYLSITANDRSGYLIMTLTTVSVTAILNGRAVDGALIEATLESSHNTLFAMIASSVIDSAVTNAGGNGFLQLIPYSQFTAGGIYRIKVLHDRKVIYNLRAKIPDTDCTLDSLLNDTSIFAVSPMVTTAGTITGPIIIGDDYLASIGRAFQWTIAALTGFTAGTSVCRFGGRYKTNAWLVTGTVLDVGGGNWTLTFNLPRTSTTGLAEGYYEWSVEVANASGSEFTRVSSGRNVLLIDKQT